MLFSFYCGTWNHTKNKCWSLRSDPDIKLVQSDASGHFNCLHYTPSSVQLGKWKQLILPWQKNKSNTRWVNRCFCVFVCDSLCEGRDRTFRSGGIWCSSSPTGRQTSANIPPNDLHHITVLARIKEFKSWLYLDDYCQRMQIGGNFTNWLRASEATGCQEGIVILLCMKGKH